jgi:hypothetical protein
MKEKIKKTTKKILLFIASTPILLWNLTLGADTNTLWGSFLMLLCLAGFARLLWQFLTVWLPGM